ncbi:MAG: MBOAT family O-acyltransferase [Saprospiraceae bacterium]
MASYIFYGWWDWRFLFLILISTLIDFFVGLQLSRAKEEKRRKLLLGISLGANLGMLGFFKYYNFFIDNFVAGFSFFGFDITPTHLDIILPVGISFYTFQTLSYTIDVYKRQIEPTTDFIAFAAFVSYFPQLVAGPIERASNLLPQINSKRTFDYSLAMEGVFQILWGLFKKVLIADNCAPIVNNIFASDHSGGSLLVLGIVLFAFQIYGDFSGYSDIAIGVSKLFGIRLMTNFRFPYFSRNIGEFWRRWHISLSTWFRDYLYIPLGGSRKGTYLGIRNVFIIFLVSGFWHGANWTFIFWGAFHALLFVPSFILGRNKKYYARDISATSWSRQVIDLALMLKTFTLITFAWIFFRAQSMTAAFTYIRNIFRPSLLTIPKLEGRENTDALLSLLLIVILLSVEWKYRNHEYALEGISRKSSFVQLGIIIIITILLFFFAGVPQDFIYFQF